MNLLKLSYQISADMSALDELPNDCLDVIILYLDFNTIPIIRLLNKTMLKYSYDSFIYSSMLKFVNKYLIFNNLDQDIYPAANIRPDINCKYYSSKLLKLAILTKNYVALEYVHNLLGKFAIPESLAEEFLFLIKNKNLQLFINISTNVKNVVLVLYTRTNSILPNIFNEYM